MKLQYYYKKLIDSEEYKKFKQNFPEAFICSGFFILDILNRGKENRVSIDFWVPGERRICSFEVHNSVGRTDLNEFCPKIPEKLVFDYDLDFKSCKDLIEREMIQKELSEKVHKILFSLQRLEKKDYLLATVFLSGLKILRVNIDVEKMKIISFDKKSFWDLIKINKRE